MPTGRMVCWAADSLDEICNYVYEVEDLMGLYERKHPIEQACGLFAPTLTEEEVLTGADVAGIHTTYLFEMEHLRERISKIKSMSLDVEIDGWADHPTRPIEGLWREPPLLQRINNLAHAVDDAYELLTRTRRMYSRATEPELVREPDAMSSVMRATTIGSEDEKMSAFQKLILMLLNKIQKNNWRRYKGEFIMQQVCTNKHDTRAWSPVPCKASGGAPMTITRFVASSTPKETNVEQWKMMTSKASMPLDLTHHLQRTDDIQFPEITKTRSMWSFHNGILDGKTMTFYPYDSPKCAELDPSLATAKYFPQDLKEEWLTEDWYTIPTPHIQHILDFQKFDREVSEWMYAFLGRLCFDVNELDGWQVIPFLKGLAGTGKSTIVTKVAKNFYEAEDVKTMSNNIEKKFGLSSIMDAYLFLAPEVKGDIALDQAEFQSCISGEDVSVAVKNHQARSGNWKVPGIMAGNEVPNWRDNSGSILRRIVTFGFDSFVNQDQVDTQLGKKLVDEVGITLVKCLRAYHTKIAHVGRKDVWDCLPPYFHEVQKKISQSTSPVQNFLDSDRVQKGKGLKVPKSLFVQHFKAHCQDNSLGTHKITNDLFAGPFCRLGMRFQKLPEGTYNDERFPPCEWVIGADIAHEHGQSNFC